MRWFAFLVVGVLLLAATVFANAHPLIGIVGFVSLVGSFILASETW